VEVRTKMSSRLKAAVAAAEPSPYLATRIMAHVRAQGSRPGWLQRRAWAGASTAVLAVLIAGVAYKIGDVRSAVLSQDAYISQLVRKVSAVMGPGLSDHVHCSVFRKYPKDPPPIEILHRQIGPEYKELLEAVRLRVPSGYRVHMAHECGYNERSFIHIGLHDGARQLSVVLARRQPGESFRGSDLLPVLASGGLKVYGASAERFHIAGMDTDTHLAYVVSELPDRQTRELMAALAPAVHATVDRLRG
jgi:hypothetical protein